MHANRIPEAARNAKPQSGLRGRRARATARGEMVRGAPGRWALHATAIALVSALAGFFAGRVSVADTRVGAVHPSASTAASPAAPAVAARARPRARKPLERTFVQRPTELFVATDAEAEARYRQAQSRDLLGLIRQQIAIAQRTNPGGHPEAIANQSLGYLQAWVDTVMRVAPDMVDELAAEVEGVLCADGAPPAERIAMSRVLMAIPELANPRGFDCAFAKHPEEDIALWYALDAWRASGLPRPAALDAIARAAQDERTLERLAVAPRDPASEPLTDVRMAQPLDAPIVPP
jgi:hypothetical protein